MRKKKARKPLCGVSVFSHMDEQIRRKRLAGRYSTADLHRASRNWLRACWGNDLLTIPEITPALVDRFHAFLKARGHLKVNSINSYMSCFRAMYNQIMREESIPRCGANPFEHLCLRPGKTAKRSVSVGIVEEIAALDLADKPEWERARDLSLFSFLGCGIPFADQARLTGANIIGDELVYNRVKTDTLIRVRITTGMRLLIDKYALPGSPYLFPILTPIDGEPSHEAYKRALRQQNEILKRIGKKLSAPFHFTSYVMRHTWASEALRQNTPVAVISQALGHTSEKTTRHYLADLDQSMLDKANRLVTGTVERLMARAG